MTNKPPVPYVATGGNVTSAKLPRFVSPTTTLLIENRVVGKVKLPIFRGQDTGRLRGRTLQRLRARMFAMDPLCAECRRQGRVRKWDELDHIIPLFEGGSNDDHNLQGLCYECHGIKTAEENLRAASAPAWPRGPL